MTRNAPVPMMARLLEGLSESEIAVRKYVLYLHHFRHSMVDPNLMAPSTVPVDLL
jgi:hypothetical protein